MAEPQTPGSASQGARCALHFGQPFTTICKRCGTYMCQACSEQGKFEFCPACRARTGVGAFPLRRDALRWGELFQFALTAYKRDWLVLTLTGVIGVAGLLLIQGLPFFLTLSLSPTQTNVLLSVLVVPQMLLQGLLALGLLTVSIQAARGEPVALKMLFGQWRRLGAFLLQMLIVFVILIPTFALLIGPIAALIFLLPNASALASGVAFACLPVGAIAMYYVILGLSFASFELVAQPELGALDALRNSWAIARGKRLTLMFGGGLCALIMFVGFACGLGAPFAFALASLLFASLYLTLRNGADGLLS